MVLPLRRSTPTGAGLGKYGFTDLVLGPQPHWLMDQGFLCKYKLYGATGEMDTKACQYAAVTMPE